MEISEVRIKLMTDPNDRLKAFCSITLDGAFVIRDLKIIQGGKGPFVAMPSRKLTDKCPRCSAKNNLRAAFCNDCGHRLQPERALKGTDGRAKLYADVAHPINSECRDLIQEDVLRAYEEELILAAQPGYVCHYDDYGEDTFAASEEDDWESPSIGISEETLHTGPQLDTHANQPLRGPHIGAKRGPRERQTAVLASERDRPPSDPFGDGIL
ncbi:MAG: SpoVG family protein [Planctomycetaceae bacterium]|nr:SpoVG family protein [Planctomycetaceae bacterium]